MYFQYVPFIWTLLASTLVILALAIYALQHKDVKGAVPFSICMFLTALWSGSYALELAGTDLFTKLFWTNVQCISYSFAPVLWLIMVFRFIERDHWVTRRNILLLLILPFLTVILAWTNNLHGLMWQNARLDINGPFPVVAKTFGPWFWVIAAYSYLLNILSESLLALSLRRKSALYREQSRALFIGLALLFIQNALYIFGIHPVPRYDLTPVVAGVSGLYIAWGIFRYRLFDIVPVARENIIENMDDGLIVLDARNRIADMNRTAKTIFGPPSIRAIGQKVEAFFKNQPAFAEISCGRETLPRELVIQNESDRKTFEVSYLSLQDRRGKHNGLTIIFHDVTERRLVQARLLGQERALAMSEERERLARDLHDNLGQIFGFINIQAQAIKHELASAGIGIASHKLERLVEVAKSAHQEMREYIQNVKITAAAEKNFVSAVKKEIEQYIKQTGIEVKLRISDEPVIEGLEPNIKLHMINIAKEALNNIRKHAEAKQVSIEVKVAGSEIFARIEDNGKGFDVMKYEKEPAHGFGLSIMKERAGEIGGDIRIDSNPGEGTRILLRVPQR
ncbi:histidine kinase N-terminal 7TM domain-containing protein [Candidatus Formimonas warabiya]|uniref:Oxygen sensor histidine kinase NreB n=1 Tax=Formimonas warabiya TaxID=1761012 RepID=A0A3G1L0I9_FORW1|nr:histidine kinase N-terminal 7TM domain-containing protein [Candidatus Formimonas warabiya]ATW28161.1 hypothetical protein DCMF_28445 [Candidatus Formimonas warabiya]